MTYSLAAIAALCLALCCHLPAAAASDGASAPATGTFATETHTPETARSAARKLVLGATRLKDAEFAWAASGAKVLQSGYLAVGAGSGRDGLGSIAVKEVLLVDVEGIDFEGLSTARYAFVDEMLYSIQVRLKPAVEGLDKNSSFKSLSDEEVKALEKRLRQAYGPPSRSGSDTFGSKRPNVHLWNLGEREMVLTVNGLLQGSQLIATHKALAKKAKSHAKATCKQHKGCFI